MQHGDWRGGSGEHVLHAGEMAEADRLAIAGGVSGYELMLRAGAGVARVAAQMTPENGRVLVVCGRGNNGGDGYVAARLLRGQGFHADVMAPLGPPQSADGKSADGKSADAIAAAGQWAGTAVAVETDMGGYDLIIDALFGAGLARPLADIALETVACINAAGRPVLAVDLPSGVDADTGQISGGCVKADATVTFAARKPGHLLLPGRTLCGALTCIDIGIAPEIISQAASGVFRNTPGLWGAHFPVLSPDAHKYRRGHVLCGSGGPLATGASRLAARGALRVGAGLVTIAANAEACRIHAAHLTAIMIAEAEGSAHFDRLLEDARFNAVVLGPAGGVGDELAERVAGVMRRGRALVIDADAISSFAGKAALLGGMIASVDGAAPVVMTPHEGEFARLFGDVPDVMGHTAKPERARAAAHLTGAVVILKGADTVIAAPDGRVAINDNAPPWLGTAGSGDVLAGLTGGLLAQGMPGFEAACAAVWIHGAAAAAFGPGLIAEDLPEQIPAILRSLQSVSSPA